jgi:16S rRNA (adenine1518-N6/adenine1519-N6)-dimethyltransferase
VESSLLVLDRRASDLLPGCNPDTLQAVIQAAFGQRRKTLVNALSAGAGLERTQAAALVEALGLPLDVRAERLRPGQFVELAARLGSMANPAGA